MKCLEGLVGFTDIDCDCLEECRPPDWNVSESGLFLTDMEYGIPLSPELFLKKDCFCGLDIWQLMRKSVDDATRDLCSDLTRALYEKFDSSLHAFSGKIGKLEHSQAKVTSKKYAFSCLEVKKKVRGGYFAVNEICLGLNCNKEVEIFIINADYPDEILHSETVTTVAGKYTAVKFEKEILLPLSDERCSTLKYKFYYEIPEGCRPLANKYTCCSDKFGWQRYFKAKGGEADLIKDCDCNSDCAYGLAIGGFLKCNGLEWLCDLGSCEGFAMIDVVARAIQMRAISKLIYALMNGGGEINSFCLLSAERLMGKRKALKSGYAKNIKWICENIPDNMTDCFTCKQNNKIKSFEI